MGFRNNTSFESKFENEISEKAKTGIKKEIPKGNSH
jgi:hypothetical protein